MFDNIYLFSSLRDVSTTLWQLIFVAVIQNLQEFATKDIRQQRNIDVMRHFE